MKKQSKNKKRRPTLEDSFKHYCELLHIEDKVKHNNANYNYMQNVFSQTELFDITNIIDTKEVNKTCKKYIKSNYEMLKNITLPFNSVFVRTCKLARPPHSLLYLHEYSPKYITGTIIYGKDGEQFLFRASFHINVNTGILSFDTETPASQYLADIIIYTINVLNNLSSYSVCADIPETSKVTYFTRKKETTIKRERYSIYYVLDKSEETEPKAYNKIITRGHLEFTHSFKVRSHWRNISPTSFGKDRNGNYNVQGKTFIKEYVKGEGEMVRKLHIVK